MPIVFILFSYVDEIFLLFLGEEWQKTGEYALILSIYLLFQISTSPFTMNILIVFQSQKYFLLMNIVRALMVIIIFFTSYLLKFSLDETLIVYSVALSFYYVVIQIFALSVVRGYIV